MDLKVLFLLLGSSFLISLVSGNQAIDNKDFAVDHIENERRVNEERKSNSERVCANGCTGHGDCVNGACSCWFGWTGSDCSIYEQAVSSGQLYANQSVSTFNWRYYYITSTSNRDIIAEVTQTSNGDCDMYVQLNDLPTRSDYLYRNITTDSTFEVTVPAAQSGTWYFGIYGFSACTYQIRITIASLCPANCNGHGTCMSGQCRCYAGYTGTDCGTAVNVLAVNTPVSGSLALHEFVVYQFTMQSGNLMVFAVQETGDGDCDLYLKFEGIPSTTSWDYANVTTHDFSSLSVTDPQFGDWYLEIYGYSACSYILTAVVEVGCPNNCSNRGSCGSGNCNCPTGYTGDYCQTRTAPLVDGQPDSGYVDSNNWNYYSFVTDTTNNFVIQVTQITGDGDCDLYVRAGQIPTRFNYDYFDLSVNPTFSLTIEDPGQQTWYIGIFGWEECSYTITASETSNCPETGCSNHGTCQTNGVCLCNAQWTGAACEYQMVPLGNKVAIGGTVNYNTWNFYSFQIDGTSSLNILVKETSTTGLLWVYVAKTYPTIHEYLYSETGSGNIHRISIDFDDEENAVYQIGIYGNPYLLAGQSVSYQIVAYAPDF